MIFNREFRITKKDIIEVALMLIALTLFIIGLRSLHSPHLWTGKANNALTGYFSLTFAAVILWFYAFIKFFVRHKLTIVVIFFTIAVLAYASSYKVLTVIKAKYLKHGTEEKAVIIKPQNF